MARNIIDLPTLGDDGRLYRDTALDLVESLIPNPWKSCHAPDLLELENGDLLCCWFAGSREGNADISIAVARLPADAEQWEQPVIVSDDPTRSEQNPSLFQNPNGDIWLMYTAQAANNNASISAIKLQSGALAIIYNDVSFNEDGSRTVWPDQRCPVAMALSEDGGKTWPWRRIVEHGEGFIGPWNDVNNRRYEYPVMMQSKDGKIHAAYAWGRRVRIKYVCVDEAWIRGAKVCKGAEDNPEMPCNR